MSDYIEVKSLIDYFVAQYHLRDPDLLVYDEIGVAENVLVNRGEEIYDIIYSQGQSFSCDMISTSHLIIRLAILKDIYKNGGYYIHCILKDFIIDSEKNPARYQYFCQYTYEKIFQKVIGIFLKEFSIPVPKEKLILNQDKKPLTWWKDQVSCLAVEEG